MYPAAHGCPISYAYLHWPWPGAGLGQTVSPATWQRRDAQCRAAVRTGLVTGLVAAGVIALITLHTGVSSLRPSRRCPSGSQCQVATAELVTLTRAAAG
jgi:hypothetical protein